MEPEKSANKRAPIGHSRVKLALIALIILVAAVQVIRYYTGS